MVVEHIATAREQALYSPQVLAALDPSPRIPADVRFALVTELQGAKPFAYATLADLARRIQRDRGGDPIQMTPMRFRFRDGLRGAVRVTAEDAGGRIRLIGDAWISGIRDETIVRTWSAAGTHQSAAEALEASRDALSGGV